MVEEGGVVVNQGGDKKGLFLPPGFRFHPTDEEIVTHYLKEKVLNTRFTAEAIGQADLNKNEPWDLPNTSKTGEKELYVFCQRDRKYPTGMRTNRATVSGYWKATGKDKEIFRGKGRCLVGMKKTLVFYKGRAPKGGKTNWVMHEYRLDGKYSYHNLPESARDEWVVCRIFHKNAPTTTTTMTTTTQLPRIDSLDNIDHLLDFSSLPPLIDPGFLSQPGSSFFGAGQQHDLKPVHHSTTAPLDNTYPSTTQTLNFPNYHTVYNSRSDYGYLAGNNNKGMIKLEHSLASASQETGLSSDVNTTATPEISSYPMMMDPAANAEMMDGNTSACDDLDDLIFWADLVSN